MTSTLLLLLQITKGGDYVHRNGLINIHLPFDSHSIAILCKTLPFHILALLGYSA